MNTLYSRIIIITLCLILSACSIRPPFTMWTGTGHVSGTIWYTPITSSPETSSPKINSSEANSPLPIPLLVHAEWEAAPIQKGNLALVFLHGGLFAQCQYDNAQFICDTKTSFPGAANMAYACAMLVSAAINDLQGNPLPNLLLEAVTLGFTVQAKPSDPAIHLPRTYSIQDDKAHTSFDITEATWR